MRGCQGELIFQDVEARLREKQDLAILVRLAAMLLRAGASAQLADKDGGTVLQVRREHRREMKEGEWEGGCFFLS